MPRLWWNWTGSPKRWPGRCADRFPPNRDCRQPPIGTTRALPPYRERMAYNSVNPQRSQMRTLKRQRCRFTNRLIPSPVARMVSVRCCRLLHFAQAGSGPPLQGPKPTRLRDALDNEHTGVRFLYRSALRQLGDHLFGADIPREEVELRHLSRLRFTLVGMQVAGDTSAVGVYAVGNRSMTYMMERPVWYALPGAVSAFVPPSVSVGEFYRIVLRLSTYSYNPHSNLGY